MRYLRGLRGRHPPDPDPDRTADSTEVSGLWFNYTAFPAEFEDDQSTTEEEILSFLPAFELARPLRPNAECAGGLQDGKWSR